MVKKMRLFLLLFLTITVLVSSPGITVFKMSCLKNGKSYQSLEQFNTCCKSDLSHEAIQNRCCEYSKVTYKVDIFQKTNNPASKVVTPVAVNLFANSLFHPYQATFPLTNPYDSPPPPNGTALLTLQSILII